MVACLPVGVLLPTTGWTDACTEVAAQLEDHGEFLLIHDGESDPITERQHTPEGIQLVPAGDPECWSGIGQWHRRDTHRGGGVTTPF